MNRARTSEIIGIFVGLAGLAVMFAWIFDWEAVKSVTSTSISMKFTTALCFFVTGIMIFITAKIQSGEKSIIPSLIIYLASLCLMVFMGTFLVGSMIDFYTGLEDLFLKDSSAIFVNLFPGRPAVFTMLAFMFISLSGFCFLLFNRIREIFVISGSIAALIGIIPLIGYAINESRLYYLISGFSNPVAINTAILFVVCGIALILIGKRPYTLPKGQGNERDVSGKPIRILVIVTLSVSITEVVVMSILEIVLTGYYTRTAITLLDAIFLAIFTYPILVLLVLKPLIKEKMLLRTIKEKEEYFKSIFDNAGVGTALLASRTGRFIHVNKKYADFFGYTAEEMETLYFQNITRHDDIQANKDFLAFLLDGKNSTFTMESRYKHKNGSFVWGRLTISPLLASGKSQSDFVAIIEDIAERKNQELELAKKINALEVFHKATIGREKRIIELKEQLRELKAKLGVGE